MILHCYFVLVAYGEAMSSQHRSDYNWRIALLILRMCMQAVENLMEGANSIYLILFHWLSTIHAL